MPIDSKLIDIEFSFDGYRGQGDERDFGEEFPTALLIPKSEWKDRIQDLKDTDPFENSVHPKGCIVANYGNYVFNQAPESSCVLNATAGAIMRRWNMQLGLKKAVVLSPMSAYCQLAKSRNSGSYMLDALELTRTKGILPSDKHKTQYKHTFHENTPFVRESALPEGWEETGKLFKVLEWLRCNSLEQFMSALLNQYPVVYGRSGHSIVGEDPIDEKNKFYCRSCDSYGFDNRDGTGRIYDSERMMSTSGAWACRVVTVPEFN
jgi:hypothetical protein